ncbi:MAG TPA: replication factor C small subunit [Candidatus Nanoarchaeia archaeon]|nr:replication factor C small subunit [Candidatus Nanoarchaeia archaeon]
MEEDKIWIEKYRPRSFDEIMGHDVIVSRLKSFVERKNIPHLLLSGPAGVGKTSIVLVIVKALYGERWKENFLELNASDDRGIDVVRTKIKDFAKTIAIGEVPFKVILLDECDSLTSEAQQALRRTMEQYSGNCRFFLSCNYSSKIIDPIQSRCTIFRFKQLEKKDVEKIVENIAGKEGLKIKDNSVDALYEIANGDARRVGNILQSCASLSKTITPEIIYEMSSSAKPKEIQNLLDEALMGNFLKARTILLDVMLKHGLSGVDVVKQIQREVFHLSIADKIKIGMIQDCGECEFRLVEGSDDYVQLEALIARFCSRSAR